jgi:hypothetical protein
MHIYIYLYLTICIDIYGYRMRNLVFNHKGITQIEASWEQATEENI